MTQLFYKFLAGNLASGHMADFYYPAPTYDLKRKRWKPGAWITASDVTKRTLDDEAGAVCGHGLHLMKIPCPRFVRWSGNAYLAEGKALLGEDNEKARFRRVRLLRPLAFTEIFHEKANLSRADLSGANLSGADLSEANLSEANLSRAYLFGADLSGANLSRAYLSEANLSEANLSEANLSRAYLFGADLSGADLSGADLSGAYLSEANLSEANLSEAIVLDEQLKRAATMEGIIR